MITIKKEQFFYWGLISGILYNMLAFAFGDGILVTILQVLCAVCMLTKIMLDRYNLKTLLIFAIFMGITLYTAIIAETAYVFLTTVLILAMKNVDIDKSIRYVCYVRGVVLILFFFMFLIIFFTDRQSLRYYTNGEVNRYALMFTHPNNAAIFWFWHLVEYVYTKFNCAKRKDYLYVGIMGLVVWGFTRSDIFLLVYFLLIVLYVGSKVNVIQKSAKFVAKYGFTILSLFFVMLLFFRDNIVYYFFNVLTTGRINMNAKAYDNFGFSLFGQPFESSHWLIHNGKTIGYLVLDNFYIRTVIGTGVLYLVLICIGCMCYAKYLNYARCMCIMLLAVYGMAEQYVGNVFIVFPLLFIGDAVINKRKYKMQSLVDGEKK